jgi:hypothetical protein
VAYHNQLLALYHFSTAKEIKEIEQGFLKHDLLQREALEIHQYLHNSVIYFYTLLSLSDISAP